MLINNGRLCVLKLFNKITSKMMLFALNKYFAIVFVGHFAFGISNPISIVSNTTDSEDVGLDYYWRDFTGIIPNDAIPGGLDRSGKTTYIGQMLNYNFGLLPATIYQWSKFAHASGGGSSFTDDNFVKILCSRHHDRYLWIPTKNDEGHLLTGYHLVIGGTEAGYVLNIGRVNHEMEVVLGKVFANHTPHKGLSIPNKTKEAVYQSYEILVYLEPNASRSLVCGHPR